MLRLLIAGDASDVAEVIAVSARMIWPDCQVTIVSNGEEALRRCAEQPVDLVVLDVSMPPADGFEVCRRIREVSMVPMLILSLRDRMVDRVRALDLGADDYLTKPFDHLELLAHLKALVRRSSSWQVPTSTNFAAGDFSLDFALHEVRMRGEVVLLTSTEYRLLEELVRHAGTVLPHRTLLEQVWGADSMRNAHYLKVFVRRLRQKLGDDTEHRRYIQTEWGIGYRFAAPR